MADSFDARTGFGKRNVHERSTTQPIVNANTTGTEFLPLILFL
jgi:hypothetical protein